mgnify:CR=1 FL=1
MAAFRTAKAIAAKFARKADKSVGDLKISYNQQYNQYMELAEKLELEAQDTVGTPWSGATSISSKESEESNTDRVKPSITRGMNDNPSVSNDINNLADD